MYVLNVIMVYLRLLGSGLKIPTTKQKRQVFGLC